MLGETLLEKGFPLDICLCGDIVGYVCFFLLTFFSVWNIISLFAVFAFIAVFAKERTEKDI